jgi:antitoxin ParD1/3/4
MNVEIGPVLTRFVTEHVATGLYESESKVVREGLRLLKDREDLKGLALESLWRDLAIGLRQAEEGRTRPFNEQTVARIKANGRKRLAARSEFE